MEKKLATENVHEIRICSTKCENGFCRKDGITISRIRCIYSDSYPFRVPGKYCPIYHLKTGEYFIKTTITNIEGELQ